MPSDIAYREYTPGDIPALCALWKTVFGDKGEVISAFFRLLPEMGTCAVCVRKGEIVGMASVITGLSLVRSGADTAVCGYVYAVATAPAARGRGIGAALTETVCALARARGASLLCTLPAEDSLYPWYERVMGVECALHRKSFDVIPAPGLAVCRLSAAEYSSRREELLSEKPHLCAAPAVIEFADKFYSAYGGGLYACGDSLCAAYADSDRVYIKELISLPGAESASAAALGAFLGAEKITYFLPDKHGEKYISAPPAMLSEDCIWNLSFD